MGQSSKRRTAHILLGVTALLYAGFIWEIFAGYPLDPSRSYLSELAAADQSTSTTFRLLDAGSAVVILIALSLIGRIGHGWRDPLRWVAVGLGVFAVGTAADAVFPMECATSVDLRCVAAQSAGSLGWVHQVHTGTSVFAFAGIVLAVAMTGWATWRAPGLSGPVRIGAVTLAVALLASTAAGSVVALFTGEDGLLLPGSGYVLRAQVVLVCLYLGTVGPLIGAIESTRAQPSRTDDGPRVHR